jgi:hypothetical protein
MSAWLIVHEAKWMAHGGHTSAQGLRWMLWIYQADHVGRATPIPPITLAGNSWAVECDTREDAEWVADYLIDACGFTATMLSITTRRGDW